jgi:hypothetical protein
MFAMLNALLYFLPPHPLPITGVSISYADLLGLVWITANLGVYLVVMITELKRLAREEPARLFSPPKTRGEQER